AQHLHAVDAGHAHVGDDHLELLGADALQGLLTVGGGDHQVALARQQVGEEGANVGLIVDDQQLLSLSHTFSEGWAPPVRGTHTFMVVPLPGALDTSIAPPCASTIRRARGRPRPVPWPTGLVVKKGSKMRGMTSSGMPLPPSRTATSMPAAPARARRRQ